MRPALWRAPTAEGHPMRRTILVPVALAAALLATACQSDAPATPEVAPIPTVSAEADAETVAYQAAVRRTIDARSLTTDAVVRVATGAGVAEFTITVRRDGDRREIDVTTDQGTLQYVIDADGATVDRGNGPEAVSTEEVPSAPSLGALSGIEELAFPEPGVATGILAGSAIAADGAVTTSVAVTVRYDIEGIVHALELRGPDDDYVALLTYRLT